ncbi:protein-glutamate methylesterase/protein-glutamine glutaminase [Aureibacillus halotolerans]|uniref:Protein-glutamate methylesterase/protein-glutamine glutaminase n=1 Tax=Aureibacillus halotolerans TaxID=1508390 RepID=A0A4V3D5D6_9BACI|nr:chemotaxis response regulator protein-glutamate methylesterase [Aureibacillus halotolerans]TDQ39667.1 two-component system chemotaxis response regulator CheB [Aureibacillus halotolerans]
MRNKIRVLIVDDSAFMRKLIRSFLESHPDIEIVDIARNGEDAVEKAKRHRPDVMTMDVEMPVKNGLEAVSEIMAQSPCAIIMLSSVTIKGAELTIDAMQRGAIDFVQKPSGAISLDLDLVKDELVQKVVQAASANPVYKQPVVKQKPPKVTIKQPEPVRRMRTGRAQQPELIVIGSSTGGPRALAAVLTNLPKDFQTPIVIVQHMPPGFTGSLAKRLHQQSRITVKEASHAELLKKGHAYIAPGGVHLVIERVGSSLAACLSTAPPLHRHRPSVDVLCLSVAKLGIASTSVILTGMGKDGTKGVRALKEQGRHYCIAQSKRTSIIHGMPGSIIQSELHDEETDIDKVADSLCQKLLPAGGITDGNQSIS